MNNNTVCKVLAITSLAITTLFAQGLIAEQVFKCTHPDGSVSFSDTACENTKSEVVDVVVNEPMDSTDIRSKMAEREAEIKKKSESTESNKADTSSDSETSSKKPGSSSMTCKSAKRVLSFYDDGNLGTINETLKAKADVEAACGEKVITKKEIAVQEKERRDSVRPIIIQRRPEHGRRQHCDAFGCLEHDDEHQMHDDNRNQNVSDKEISEKRIPEKGMLNPRR